MSNPTIQVPITTPDGKQYTAILALSVLSIAAVAPPPPVVSGPTLLFPLAPGEPAIDDTWTQVNCDPDSATWKSVWDNSTPGSAATVSGSSSFVSAAVGRQYTMKSSTQGGGIRHSCHAVPSGGQAARQLVYETVASGFAWKTLAQRFELDINVVDNDSTGNYVLMGCMQQECGGSHGAGVWDLTYNAKWSKTTLKAPMASWNDGETHSIRWHASFDNNGNVTYLGVTVDGVWYPFTSNNVGPSRLSLAAGKGWSPNGLIIPNFQFEFGVGTLSGTALVRLYYK